MLICDIWFNVRYIIAYILKRVVFNGQFVRKSATCHIAASYGCNNNKFVYIFTYIYYAAMMLLIIVSFLILHLTNSYLKSFLELNNNDIKRYTNKLKLYPLIQLLTIAPQAIYRIITLYKKTFNLKLAILELFCDSSRGICFVAFFGLSPTILKSAFNKSVKIDKIENNNRVSYEYNLNNISSNLIIDGSFISNTGEDFEFGKRYK